MTDRPADQTHGTHVQLVDPDPHWPELFEGEAGRISAALGGLALGVEHIGSTAVPGLAAKPTIDILLVVTDSANEEASAPALEATGFALRIREPQWHEHRLFKGSDPDANLHVFSEGCPGIERMLLPFRDRLRTSGPDRRRYERVKRELAARDWTSVQDYADAKRDVVEGILAGARPSEG